MVYQKSYSGMQEISGNQRALNLRQRQVLIMIDGKRSQDDLEKHLNHLDVAEIVADLKKLGYINDPTAPAVKPETINTVAPVAVQPVQDSATDAGQTAVMKEILLSSAREYLGIMGQSMTQKIEAAQSLEQVKACISQWHMAIRESKLGKPVAGVLMEQVQQILANPI